ncbi:MAG: GNAT family N-acetyltransferase [Dehalococcoidia bacterium]|jgi:ribosomal protein S18 acetylase RimI-like enzyme|nr:GNAT family N-acetyltransferase [Dehalococcoidia bacterium]
MYFALLHNRDEIETYLRRSPDKHVYRLGDLDDTFWPRTSWYGARKGDELRAICLVFSLYDPSNVVAISEPDNDAMPALLNAIAADLPDFSEIHLGPEALGALDERFEVTSLVPHWKMTLRDRSRLESADTSAVRRLGTDEVPALEELFDAVYAGREATNVFYPSMLDVGPYFGVEIEGRIVSSAGVHVYSKRRRVAAIANVATHPDFRGRGLATSVVAGLAAELALNCDHIGLNVAQANESAIRAYKSAGFEIIAEYYEGYITRRG